MEGGPSAWVGDFYYSRRKPADRAPSPEDTKQRQKLSVKPKRRKPLEVKGKGVAGCDVFFGDAVLPRAWDSGGQGFALCWLASAVTHSVDGMERDPIELVAPT